MLNLFLSLFNKNFYNTQFLLSVKRHLPANYINLNSITQNHSIFFIDDGDVSGSAWWLFLRPGSQVSWTSGGISLQRGDSEEPHQDWATTARHTQLLRQLSQHHRQQDHGGHHDDGEAVRGGEGRVWCIQASHNNPTTLQHFNIWFKMIFNISSSI